MSETVQRSESGDQPVNEDRLLVVNDETGHLLVVADGMGGHDSGDLAAQAVIDSATEAFGRRAAGSRAPELLQNIFETAHARISTLKPGASEFKRPRSTAVAVLIEGNEATWAHVGDSRLYLFRDGEEIARTRDHTTSYSLYNTGNVMREDLRAFIRRNQLERSLGGATTGVDVEVGDPVLLQNGDILLLCSDGVWSTITGYEMAEHLVDSDFDAAIGIIMESARDRGAPDADNLSIAAYRHT